MEKNQPYKQDKVFDNILETEEFNVYTKIDDLPLDENPMYLEEGINGKLSLKNINKSRLI